jgi:diaminopimelate epimerase
LRSTASRVQQVAPAVQGSGSASADEEVRLKLPFVKMQGLGNDFVVVDCREEERNGWEDLVRRLSHRRLGVGCDQVLLIRPSAAADAWMDIYNADGSRVEMCGNGVRCVARYLWERGGGTSDALRIETLGGVVSTRCCGDDVEVDMGEPEFDGRKIPVDADGPVMEQPLQMEDGAVKVSCVAIGNPHAVIFVEDAESYPVETVGPLVERHPFFPNRINVEFVQVRSRTEIRMRVWERGVGVTMACGTGACAAAAVSHWTGRAEREVEVVLDGGNLGIRWEKEPAHLFMTGPAALVFEGSYYL